MYITKSPSVIVPARIARPPTTIISTPMTPTMSVDTADDGGDADHRLRDVPEQPVDALREDQRLAPLGRVGLDDADAAERFGEPAGDLGVDLAALAEQRPQARERHRHHAAEDAEQHQRDRRQPPVEPEEHAQRDRPPSAMLPTSCTMPLPTRFRMPSASLMMREMSTPVFVESK